MRLASGVHMSKTVSLVVDSRAFADSTSTTDAIVRRRIGLAALLTGVTIGIGACLGIALGPTAVLLFALPLPVPLALLWLSSDVLRADE